VVSRKPGLTKRDLERVERIRRDLPKGHWYVGPREIEFLLAMLDRLLAQVQPPGEPAP
jgi:hypothetical protein